MYKYIYIDKFIIINDKCVTHIGVSKYIKQKLLYLKRETDSNIIIAEVFNSSLLPKDR